MTTLEKIRKKIAEKIDYNNGMISIESVLQIIDKCAEWQKCDTCYHNETEFSVCQYCTDGDKYEEQEPTDEWQDGYDRAWEEAEVFYEKEEPTSPCDLCGFNTDEVCEYLSVCPATGKAVSK